MGKIGQLGDNTLYGKAGNSDAFYPITLTDATYTRNKEKLSKYVITDISAERVSKSTKLTFTSEDNTKKEVMVQGDGDPSVLTYWDINHIINDVFGF